MRSCFKINKTYCQHSNFARRGAIKATARPWLKWMFSQVCAPGAKHQRAMEHFDYIVVGAGKCLMSYVPPKNLLKICNKFWHIFRDWGFLDCLSANQRANQAVCANFGKISSASLQRQLSRANENYQECVPWELSHGYYAHCFFGMAKTRGRKWSKFTCVNKI